MPAKGQEGQVSLEYLLVMLVFLALLGLAVPLIEQAKENAAFALSCRQGQAFAWRLKTETERLQLFSSGSRQTIEFSPPTPWQVKGENGEIKVLVEGSEGKSQAFSAKTAAGLKPFKGRFPRPSSLSLENLHGEIIVSLN